MDGSLHKPQCLSVYLPSYTYWVLLITRKLGGALNRVPADKSIQEMLQVNEYQIKLDAKFSQVTITSKFIVRGRSESYPFTEKILPVLFSFIRPGVSGAEQRVCPPEPPT